MSKWTYFTEQELACKHTGKSGMDPLFMADVEALRGELGFPFVVSSAYRHPTHPVEAKKKDPNGGSHTQGKAIDIKVFGGKANELVAAAMKAGFHRIGVNQKGPYESRFIHIEKYTDKHRTMWSY